MESYILCLLPCKKTVWHTERRCAVIGDEFLLLLDSKRDVQSRPHIPSVPSPPLMPASLHNNIRRLRFERGMTQEELALRVGVSRQTIMSIERGATNPSVLLAYKVAMALQSPVIEVFQMEGGLVPV